MDTHLGIRCLLSQAPGARHQDMIARRKGQFIGFVKPKIRSASFRPTPDSDSIQEQIVTLIRSDMDAYSHIIWEK